MVRINYSVKWRTLLFALFFTVQAVLIPVRQAQALIPVLGAVGAFLKTPIGKAYATSAAIHAAVLAIEFHDWATSPSLPPDDTTKRLEVKINPKDPMKTPSGWTPGSSSNIEPTPPASIPATNTPGTPSYSVNGLASQSTPSAACALRFPSGYVLLGQNPPQCYNTAQTLSNTVNYTCSNGTVGTWSGVGSSSVITCGSTYICPAGYTKSGTTCNLSNASVVVKPADNMTEIKRVANVLYTDARDTLDGIPPGATVTADTVTFVDSYGDKWEYHINADGTSYSTELKPRTDGSGKTDKTTTAYTAPDATTGAVEVSGQKAEVFTGSGTLQSPTSDGSAPTQNTPCGAPGQAKCAVTVDETGLSAGTSEATADSLKASMEAAKTAATAAQTSGDMSAFGLPKYTAPGASGTEPQFGLAGSDSCVNPTGTLFGQSNFVFPVCTVVAPLKVILSWMLNVLLAMYAWYAWARREQNT